MSKKEMAQKIVIGVCATIAGAYVVKWLKGNKLL